MKRPTLTAERPSAGALVLALAVPPLFLHARYSPGFSISAGSTSLSVELADLAVLAVAAAALDTARRHGVGVLRRGRAVWIAAAAYLGLVLAGTLYGPAVTDGYPFASSLVSAAKYAEYAVLAVARCETGYTFMPWRENGYLLRGSLGEVGVELALVLLPRVTP